MPTFSSSESTTSIEAGGKLNDEGALEGPDLVDAGRCRSKRLYSRSFMA